MLLYSRKEGEIMKNIFNQISTNTYEKTRDISLIAPVFITLTNSFMNNQIILLLSPLLISAEILGNYLTYSKNIEKTKNIVEIKNLYQEFLNNYNKLNLLFEFKTPLEVYALFTKLLNDGYLSQNHKQIFSDKNAIDISVISGANVFTGQSVCRHQAQLLTDILNNYQIESYSIGCYDKQYEINAKEELTEIDYQTYIKTKPIINTETKEFKYQYFDKIQNKYFLKYLKFEKKEKKEKNIVKLIGGNHRICLSKQNGKNYFLDPTQSRIYRLSVFDKKLLQDKKGDVIIKPITSDKKTKQAIKSLEPNNISEDEEIETLIKIKKLYYENSDVFEIFYSQNKELYEDISNELMKIKKKRFHI